MQTCPGSWRPKQGASSRKQRLLREVLRAVLPEEPQMVPQVVPQVVLLKVLQEECLLVRPAQQA